MELTLWKPVFVSVLFDIILYLDWFRRSDLRKRLLKRFKMCVDLVQDVIVLRRPCAVDPLVSIFWPTKVPVAFVFTLCFFTLIHGCVNQDSIANVCHVLQCWYLAHVFSESGVSKTRQYCSTRCRYDNNNNVHLSCVNQRPECSHDTILT